MERLNIIHTKIRFDKQGDRDNNLYTVLPENFWEVVSFCHWGSDKLSLRWCQSVTLTTHSSTQLTKNPVKKIEKPKSETKFELAPSGDDVSELCKWALSNKTK